MQRGGLHILLSQYYSYTNQSTYLAHPHHHKSFRLIMTSLAISLETLSSDTSKHIFTISKYLKDGNLALPSFDNESLAIFLRQPQR